MAIEQPEWQKIYSRLLCTADFGDIITYAMLDAALGRPFISNRSPLYRARSELGGARSRWLVAVPQTGYRVIEAPEHMQVANAHKLRGKRQLSKMVEVANATDLTVLTSDELMEWDRQNQINLGLFRITLRHEQWLADHDAAIASILRRLPPESMASEATP